MITTTAERDRVAGLFEQRVDRSGGPDACPCTVNDVVKGRGWTHVAA